MTPLIYPNSGSLWLAGIVQTALAASDMHLFKTGTVPLTPLTELTDLDAVEADYTGYAAQTIAAWFAPLLNGLGGASIESGLLQFAITAPYTVGNMIQGWYLTETGGDLVCAGDFSTVKRVEFVTPADLAPLPAKNPGEPVDKYPRLGETA